MIESKQASPSAVEPAATYAAVLRVRSFTPLLGSSLVVRTGNAMWSVALVLFILQRYHSPALAGLAVFIFIFPGLVLSPVNGALIDRFGRRRLMILDFAVAAVALVVIVVLSLAGLLPAPLLLVILAFSSLTGTLSIAGARSLFPLTVPAELWDRANALDSFAYGTAEVVGPALAGILTAWRGGESALLLAAVAYVAGSLLMLAVHEPHVDKEVTGNVFRDALEGLRYVWTNPTLRALAFGMSVGNMGWGIMTVALPLLVYRLHGGPDMVGEALAAAGLVGVPATLLAGRMRTEGRERQIMALANVLFSVGIFALLLPSLAWIFVAMAVVGLSDGPSNLTLFSLRQRRTQRAWFGRAFAISMSLNFSGMPIGSALSGPVIAHSLTGAVIIAGMLPLVAAAVVMVAIPARDESRASS